MTPVRTNRAVRRRLLTLVVGAAVATMVVAGPAAAQADGELELQSVDSTGFPLVRATVSGPALEGDLDDAFVVTEDGETVSSDVERLRSDELNVVVALDVSGSMAGAPIESAKSAVDELLSILPPTVPVAIVTFGDSAVLQSPFTTDRPATLSAVNGLIAAGETALFDGIELSMAQLEAQGGTSGLVVLADGDDRGSETTLANAVDRLSSAEVDASFVALETDSFSPDTFAAMGEAADGPVVTVTEADDFIATFGDIAADLGNVYEVRWRSNSTGETGVAEIALASDSGQSVSAEFAHDAVGEFVPEIAIDSRTVQGAGIFESSLIPILAALFVSVGAIILFMGLRNSEGAIERREERNETRDQRKEERKRRVTGMQERLEGLTGQMLEANDRGRSLDDTLDRAGLAIRSNEFVVACAAITLASLLVGVLLFGVPFFLLALIIPGLGIPGTLKYLTRRRTKIFVQQLGDTLQLMVGSLTAGYGLGQTIDSVARETDSPTSDEFARVVMETRLGRSLEDALDAMSLRINSPDFDWVVDAIKIQASVGGDLAEILEQVGETIRARVRIKRQVDALTAEGKISALVLFVLPFGLAGFIFMSNPDYIAPLTSSGVGYVMIGTALTMLLIGGLWLRKLVNPEF